jgi:hypothetical protein
MLPHPPHQSTKLNTSSVKSKKSLLAAGKSIAGFCCLLWLVSRSAYAQKPTHIYVFVGEKIEVHRVVIPPKPNTIMMDGAFDATYRVVHNVYGGCTQDTIRFRVYDHYGTPGFAKFKHVLLYVSEYDGKLYHEKYQFSPVFKATNGRWAGPYATDDYKHPFLEKEPTQVKPEAIPFGPDAFIDITGYAPENSPAAVSGALLPIGRQPRCSGAGQLCGGLVTAQKRWGFEGSRTFLGFI